jgi:hypothetical protein
MAFFIYQVPALIKVISKLRMQCWAFKVIVSKDTRRADREVNGGILMIKTLAALLANITERAIARATIRRLRTNYFCKSHKMLLPSRPMRTVERCQPAT